MPKQKKNKKNKKKTVFNQEVIKNNQKKCRFVSKIVNKVVRITNKEHTLHSLKNCTIKNFKNMRDQIKKCDSNTSLASVYSSKRASTSSSGLNSSKSSRKRASTSSSGVNSSKRGKESTAGSSKFEANSSKHNQSCESSDFDKENGNKSNLSRDISLFDTPTNSNNSKQRCETESLDSQKDNLNTRKSDDADTERLELIKKLINQEKKRISLKSWKVEDVSNATSDSGTFNSSFFTKRNLGKNSIDKIKELRKLPDYEKIEKFLNTPPKTYYQKGLESSLNAYRREETGTVQHWNKYSFLCRKIEQCVLNREWYNLTKLLILLADAPKSYKPFLLKATLINLICNPVVKDDESMVEKFLKSCCSCHTEEDIEKYLADLFHIKKEEESDDEKDTADEGLTEVSTPEMK